MGRAGRGMVGGMPDDHALAQAVEILQTKREDILRTASEQVNRIDIAIGQLQQVMSSTAPTAAPAPVLETTLGSKSVRTMMQELLDEDDRDWSAFEVLEAYKQRGTPVHGKDPENAVRAAINDANKAGRIERTAPGRYKSTIWRLGPDKGGLNLR